MKIERTSMLTGRKRVMDIDVTFEQLYQWESEGKPIQQVMPHLTANEREFIKTGITAEEWNEFVVGSNDEEHEEI